MKKIDGVARSVSDILAKNRYAIDYYQREYRWETKQVQELVNDLVGKFQEIWTPEHERSQVEQYPYYFLGSIIISAKDAGPHVVDGQQRLTTLTLLLTFLRRLQIGRDDAVTIDDLLMVEKFGKKSFNLDVADRVACMTALFEKGEYTPADDDSASVLTLVARFEEIEEMFPEELQENALPFFIEWLIHRVQIVQITAYADGDAYTIFETMNDRGLKLTPAEMLKGFLLSEISDPEHRVTANDLWRDRMRQLAELEKDADSDFLKTWLRSQYALKIRDTKKDAKPEDWDRIGTEFHRWLREHRKRIGLVKSSDFFTFIDTDLDFYRKQFTRIVRASSWTKVDSGLEFIGYNADQGFTLQHQLLLSPLTTADNDDLVRLKLELVGRYVDIVLAWRIWNGRSVAYSTVKNAMFNVMRDIRRLDADDLATRLHASLAKEKETFDSNSHLRVHQQNRYQLHRLLARITDYVGAGSGEAGKYLELTNRAKVRYEVEHVWADKPERRTDEFQHAHDFGEHRNLIGDLLLLPKSFNASYNDEPYAKKLPRYFSQNILARSLNPQCYEKNPGFVKFVKDSGLAFHAHKEFKAADIVERGQLYREIAKQVWDPDDLLTVAEGDA